MISDIVGVLIGTESSTFRVYKHQGDELYGKSHFPWECFSLVTKFRVFDLASKDFRVRVDLITAISFRIFMKSTMCSTIPITKKTYMMALFKMKIYYEAYKRNLTLVELFFVIYNQLAIHKTAVEMCDFKAISEIKQRLYSRFTPYHRFYRLIKYILNNKP